MNDIVIEPFSPVHGNEQVFDLIVPIQQQEFGIDITANQQPDLADISQFYQQGKGNFWVALDHGKVVGSISLKDIGDADVALRKMFVQEAYRGKEKGVAKKLLEKALNWCEEKKVRTVYLGTTPFFKAAHRFYEKSGFAEIAKESLPKSFPLMHVDTRFYKIDFEEKAKC